MDLLPCLAPVSDRYAALPVAAAFNWRDATTGLSEGEWYLVAFRSIRRADANEARLTAFDDLAHAEAAAAPGFVHYFKGPAAADRSCLSFCLWESRADAREAAGRPAHVRAVSVIAEMYEQYTLEFHRVTKGADGTLAFEPYDGPPGGHGHVMAGMDEAAPAPLITRPALAG